MKEKGIIPVIYHYKGIDQDKDFFENRSNLEEGNAGTNIYLLTKVNRILGGSLMKKWKSL